MTRFVLSGKVSGTERPPFNTVALRLFCVLEPQKIIFQSQKGSKIQMIVCGHANGNNCNRRKTKQVLFLFSFFYFPHTQKANKWPNRNAPFVTEKESQSFGKRLDQLMLIWTFKIMMPFFFLDPQLLTMSALCRWMVVVTTVCLSLAQVSISHA